jgi:hypothetical protein
MHVAVSEILYVATATFVHIEWTMRWFRKGT